MNRIQHTPEAILASALSVFAVEGVSVSTARIAAAAGVSNGTLFNYFPTKQALIDALYLSIKADLADAAGEFDDAEPIELRMRQVWDRWFGWVRQHREAHAVANLLHQSGLASAEAQAAGHVALAAPARVLTQARDSGLLVNLPLDYIASLIQSHLDQAIAFELDEEQADTAFLVLWNGITRHPTRTTPSTHSIGQ